MHPTGVGLLPGPVHSLHITAVEKVSSTMENSTTSDASVTLVWEAPQEGANIALYQVHYQPVDLKSDTKGRFAMNNVSTFFVLLVSTFLVLSFSTFS